MNINNSIDISSQQSFNLQLKTNLPAKHKLTLTESPFYTSFLTIYIVFKPVFLVSESM